MEIKLKLKPLYVPLSVEVEMPEYLEYGGIKSDTAEVKLTDIDADTLSGLCDEFRQNVFKKSNKVDPNPPTYVRRPVLRHGTCGED